MPLCDIIHTHSMNCSWTQVSIYMMHYARCATVKENGLFHGKTWF